MSASKKSVLRRRWWQILLIVSVVTVAGLWIAARIAASRLEPMAREKFIAYMEDRYQARIDFGKLNVSLPIDDPLRFALNKGQGARLRLTVDDLRVVQHGLEDLPPLLTMDRLGVVLDFPTMFEDIIVVKQVKMDGFSFTIPPKGRRPKKRAPPAAEAEPEAGSPISDQDADQEIAIPRVLVEEIIADGMQLTILPATEGRAPLIFDMANLRLYDTAPGEPMKYQAELTNPKPPGIVTSTGFFGPFNVEDAGESPLGGDFTFEQADLGVFKGITGTLRSTGKFEGQLNRIVADGESDTPDFGLDYSQNRIRLQTKYHAIIDGTNGNTYLEPVEAIIGTTRMVCEGAVARLPGENGKTVELKVKSVDGNLKDILTLAMKDSNLPLLGKLTLDIDLKVPPGKQTYANRLEVAGKFKLNDGRFTSKETRDKLNDMSSRAVGSPNEELGEDITTDFDGDFVLKNQVLALSNLRFLIPGAEVNLDGTFNLKSDELDFHGKLRTDAKLSQMMKSRWKRWALKPVDPFFSKDGAGAQFNIAITGDRDNPKFGLDR